MKITFILPGYPAKPTGGYKVVYQYANELVKRGHRVSVIHPYALRQHSLPPVGRVRWLRKQWRKVLHWQRTRKAPTLDWITLDPRVQMIYLKGEPLPSEIPDSDAIIATAWETAPYVFACPQTKGLKFHYVADYEIWYGASSKRRNEMGAAFSLPLIKLAMSSASAQMIYQSSNYNLPIPVVPLAIDHSVYHINTSIKNRNRFFLSMPYRTAPYKGVSEGLAALRIVRAQFPEIELALFGSMQIEHQLDPWMHYIQRPTDVALARLYNITSIFVVPSWAEGWGLPGMESMACGAALCSTDTGGVREYAIHEHTALIAPARDPDALSAIIIRLLNDDQLRQKLAHAGCESVSQFTWDKAVEQFEQVIINSFNQHLEN